MATIKIAEVIRCLEALAPKAYQEDYDNSGLITGNADAPISNILLSLDCVEGVVEEAIRKNCNLIIAHHPIVFRGLKRLTEGNYVERAVIKAIKNDVAIYAIHTNLDNVNTGVNKKICDKLGLVNCSILQPKKDVLAKLVTFVPHSHVDQVLEALHAAGAGNIGNYKNCSFSVEGTGRFMPNDVANPFSGQANKLEQARELRIEVIFPRHLETKMIQSLKKAHPYEEVAYYLHFIENENQEVGAGMIGELPEAIESKDFLIYLKDSMGLKVIRHTALLAKPIKKVAVCGGAGSFLTHAAMRNGAHAFVSADFKYHEFFEADNKLLIADIGHYESEIFTTELLAAYLKENFSTFAVNFSELVTNPISYLT